MWSEVAESVNRIWPPGGRWNRRRQRADSRVVRLDGLDEAPQPVVQRDALGADDQLMELLPVVRVDSQT